MASDYTGNPATFYGVIALLDDGDKRTAISVRVSLERIVDSLANLDARTADVEADALRQSTGGTLEGTITVDTTGRLTFNSGSGLGMLSGSSINVAAGALVNLSGEIRAATGGLITLQAGAQISVQAGGGIVFATGSDLTINSEVCALRHTMTPQWIQKTTGPTGNEAWYDFAGSGTWEQNDTAIDFIIRFPLRLAPGEEITSVFARVAGGGGHSGGHSGTLPDNMPALQIVKVSNGGTRTVLARTVDTSASAAAYDASHLISLTGGTETSGTMPITVTTDAHYIEFLGEWGVADTSGKLLLTAINCVTKQRTFRATAEFG